MALSHLFAEVRKSTVTLPRRREEDSTGRLDQEEEKEGKKKKKDFSAL